MQVEKNTRAGRAVMFSRSQRLEQRIASQFRHEIAGEPTDSSESRRAGPCRARTTLVVVTMADDPYTKSILEGVMQEPFKCAPGRVHFDAALNPPIVGIFQVGVAASDMRDDSAVLSTERLEQFIRGVDGFR